MATMTALMLLAHTAAPGGVSIVQVSRHLECRYTAAASLILHAANGRSKIGKLYRHAKGKLYFAKEEDAKAFDMSAHRVKKLAVPTLTTAPVQSRVFEFVASMPRGATQSQIGKDSGIKVGHLSTLVWQMVQCGRLFAVGPKGYKRYFTESNTAQQLEQEIIAEFEAMVAARPSELRLRQDAKNAAKRAERSAIAALLPPKPPKQPRPKKEPEARATKYAIEPKKIRDARKIDAAAKRKANLKPKPDSQRPTVKLSPSAQRMVKGRAPDGLAIIPAHVKVTVLPGYQGDARFLPHGQVVGGFATMGIGRYIDPSVAA